MPRMQPKIVGLRLKEFRTEVTWRRTTNYAAAVGDLNPHYLDDLQEGGLIAPPMFAVALSWPVLGHLEEFLPPAHVLSADTLRSVVHYREHISIARLVRPGDRLVLAGSVASVVPHRSGTELVLRFDVRDAAGKPVHTEFVGGLLRGVSLDGQEGIGPVPGAPALPTDLTGERPVWEAAVPIDAAAPYVYDGCSDIVFPIHTSPRFARAMGLPGIVLQGTATMAYAVRELVNRELDADATRVAVLAARFSRLVSPGTTLHVRLLSRGNSDHGSGLWFDVVDAAGWRVVTDGYVGTKSKEG